MDTITHGIAGALIGKAGFGGEDLFALRPVNRRRIVTWALMLGAIFPDSDIAREMFSRNQLLILTWHRSITHSLVCLPIWAVLLAALTRRIARWRKWDAPSFGFLAGVYALGILSHILLDLVTSFGTMIWSPLRWSRPSWDMIFIVDLALAAILLVPQWIAWAYADSERSRRRTLALCAVFLALWLVLYLLLQNVGAPISSHTAVAIVLLLAAVFLLPGIRGWGFRVSAATWSRAGLLVTCAYMTAAFLAHRSALDRVRQFAAFEHLEPEALGALPLPPSLWRWDGLIRTERGVYELRMDLAEKWPIGGKASANDAIEYRYFPDARTNAYIEEARRLPEVQKVLWFSRFPLTRFRQLGNQAVVEFSDLRFPQRPGRPPSFTYRVTFGPSGQVLSQGWLRE